LETVADPDIRLGGTIENVSQYLTFISSLKGEEKFIAKLDGGPWPDLHPLDPPLLGDCGWESTSCMKCRKTNGGIANSLSIRGRDSLCLNRIPVFTIIWKILSNWFYKFYKLYEN